MYIRFTVNYINKQSGINQGILGAAFKLSKEGRIPSSLKKAFDLHLTWFQKSLLTPNIFEDSKSLSGVCWFKNSQIEIINKVRELVPVLETCGLAVSEIRSETPGTVIYEDSQQVVAVPEAILKTL